MAQGARAAWLLPSVGNTWRNPCPELTRRRQKFPWVVFFFFFPACWAVLHSPAAFSWDPLWAALGSSKAQSAAQGLQRCLENWPSLLIWCLNQKLNWSPLLCYPGLDVWISLCRVVCVDYVKEFQCGQGRRLGRAVWVTSQHSWRCGGRTGIQGSSVFMCCKFSSEKLACSRFFHIPLMRQHPSKMSFQVGQQICCQKYFQLEWSAATCSKKQKAPPWGKQSRLTERQQVLGLHQTSPSIPPPLKHRPVCVRFARSSVFSHPFPACFLILWCQLELM